MQALLGAIREARNFAMRFLGGGPSSLNRRICTMCIKTIQKRPGGAEVEVTALLADVRGSTALAEQTPAGDPWIPIGAAVHTGTSYVGTVGEGDALDFTAVGDTINTVARLTAVAGIGEILISAAAATAAGLDTSRLERRTLELRGREETVDAWVQPASSSVATTAA